MVIHPYKEILFMKKEFVAVEIELMTFSTDVVSTSPGDDGGFWLPPDLQSYNLDLGL